MAKTIIYMLLFFAAMTSSAEENLADVLEDAISQTADCEEMLDNYLLEEAFICFDDIYDNSRHDLVRSVARQGTSLTSQRMGAYRRALTNMQEAIHLAHPHEEAVLYMARLLANYSRLLLFHEQWEFAERYLSIAQEYYDTYTRTLNLDHPETGFLIYQITASLYLEIERYSDARRFAMRAIEKALATSGIYPATSYLLLAKIEMAEERLDEGRTSAWNACKSDGNSPDVVRGCFLASQLDMALGNVQCATQAISRAKQKAESASWKDPDLMSDIADMDDALTSRELGK